MKYALLCILLVALYTVPDRFKWAPLTTLLFVTFVLLPARTRVEPSAEDGGKLKKAREASGS